MRMRSILSGGSNKNGLYTDNEELITEDEFLASGILNATRSLLRSEKILREAPALTEQQKQTVLGDIKHFKAAIQERWIKMEDPTYVLTYFNQSRAGGRAYQDVDLPRWIEALTWSPEKTKDVEKESPEI